MATHIPSVHSPEQHNLRFDVYKFAAQGFADNIATLRSVEWKVTFQVFAGYIVIGSAYFWFVSRAVSPVHAAGWATFLIWLLWVVFFLFQWRLGGSIRRAHKMYGELRDKMFKLIGEDLSVPPLALQGWYGFVSQQVLSFVAALTVTYAICVSQVVVPAGGVNP